MKPYAGRALFELAVLAVVYGALLVVILTAARVNQKPMPPAVNSIGYPEVGQGRFFDGLPKCEFDYEITWHLYREMRRTKN